MQKEEKKQKEKAVINKDCCCDEPCVRHGKCSECQAYHKEHPECGSTSCEK